MYVLIDSSLREVRAGYFCACHRARRIAAGGVPGRVGPATFTWTVGAPEHVSIPPAPAVPASARISAWLKRV